jgi:hypothetical protein
MDGQNACGRMADRCASTPVMPNGASGQTKAEILNPMSPVTSFVALCFNQILHVTAWGGREYTSRRAKIRIGEQSC